MFEIPENLPLRLAPLAWLIGSWQGWGTLVCKAEVGEGDAEVNHLTTDEPILQQIQADILGDQLRTRTSFFAGHVAEKIDPTWTATQGLDHIIAGDLLWEETVYWTVTSPLALVPADEEPRELRLTSADSRGRAILWAGVAMGPRVRLDSDAIARAPEADPVDHISRMFGLVGGELMWASENMIDGGEFETEFTGRLQRASVNEEAGGADDN